MLPIHPAEAGKLRLTIRDRGIGLPPDLDAAKSKSLGMNLIARLRRQLGGQPEWCNADQGTVFILDFPLRPGAHAAACVAPPGKISKPAIGAQRTTLDYGLAIHGSGPSRAFNAFADKVAKWVGHPVAARRQWVCPPAREEAADADNRGINLIAAVTNGQPVGWCDAFAAARRRRSGATCWRGLSERASRPAVRASHWPSAAAGPDHDRSHP